ncbi:MAG TPA: ATP-binding protein [Acidimicrobiales bacterium]|jgi:anti-sigma regulatory factor (Ser/Thr protein kinase)|nr:ATP-binding protein [Acidimicrobiales bacterium]
MRASAHFPRAPEQVAAARAFAREALGPASPQLVDDVVLMVSELVTNAVLHGAGDVEVTLDRSDDVVRVEVADEGGFALPRPGRPGSDDVTGRGLAIVDALADAWGDSVDDRGRTRVWVEVSPSPGPVR